MCTGLPSRLGVAAPDRDGGRPGARVPSLKLEGGSLGPGRGVERRASGVCARAATPRNDIALSGL